MTTAKQPKLTAEEVLANEAAIAAELLTRATNSETITVEFFKVVEHFGAMAARGKAQLSRLAIKFADACRDKDNPITADDARKVYEAYAKGHNAAVPLLGQTASVEFMGESVIKSGASILKTFGHRAVLAQGNGIYERVVRLRNELGAEDRSASAYSSFAKVNREVAKLGDAVANVETIAITDDQIISWISKKPTADKTALKRLQEMQKLIAAAMKAEGFIGLTEWAKDFDAYVVDYSVNPEAADAKRTTLLLVAAE